MMLREIVHTCSNVHVARAALASIGGEFAACFADQASRTNVSAAVLAARIVREFSATAAEAEWDGVDQAVRGADQPILSGLRYILSQRLHDQQGSADGGNDAGSPAPWVLRAGPARHYRA